MRRVWTDPEGELWVETDTPGRVVSVDDYVIERVSDKFGSYDLSDAEEACGPFWELKEASFTPLDNKPPTLRERLRASQLHQWWMHPSLWGWWSA